MSETNCYACRNKDGCEVLHEIWWVLQHEEDRLEAEAALRQLEEEARECEWFEEGG